MMLATQIAFITAFLVTLLGSLAERDRNHRVHLVAICCASAISLASTFVF